ncbi:MAG: hypothetical protein ACRDOK_01720 [Streptosporangiaceae bacterium]
MHGRRRRRRPVVCEPGQPDPPVLAERWQVPVKINPELDRGTWRLVIVTEEVLTGGGLP